MPNRLAGEKSPYLLQHADNPVDWYPWGPEALERARREDKPILVSIGYSACHWCHVMAHESFEDQATADAMNAHFINIKVDREERPDVDAIYMEAVQALTGQGGWPLNVFLTPDARPFFGGTYFPPQPRHGMAAWRQVIESMAHAYRERRADVLHNADALTDYIKRAQPRSQSTEELSPDLLRAAIAQMSGEFDWTNGGFGAAPKFPQPLALELALRLSRRFEDERAREFVELTLHRMANGGIFDQLGGGFHRYSVDSVWLVPHFEKMLYDNALLARVYLQAFQLTHDGWYRAIVERTLDYLLATMRSPEGGFYSAEDADSEGVEGKYFVWTPEQLREVLPEDWAEIASLYFGVQPGGNFEGKTILTAAASSAEIARRTDLPVDEVELILVKSRLQLRAARAQRVPPGKDTKILVSWNGLAIRALAEAGRVLSRLDYLQAAERAARFILGELQPNGRLMRSYKDGPSDIPAFLEDYAFLIESLLTLYQTTFDITYFEEAQRLAAEMIQRFWDEEKEAFFDAASDVEQPVIRPRSLFDNPIPSGSSAATSGLLRLEALTGDGTFASQAASTFRAVRDLLPRAPLAFSYLLSALDFYLSAQTQIAIVGAVDDETTQQMVRSVFERYMPNAVLAVGESNGIPVLADRSRTDGKTTAFVCEHFVCKLPVTDPGALAAQLDSI